LAAEISGDGQAKNSSNAAAEKPIALIGNNFVLQNVLPDFLARMAENSFGRQSEPGSPNNDYALRPLNSTPRPPTSSCLCV
jgi:hypothetical protein